MSSWVAYEPLAESMVITPSLRFEEFSNFYRNGYEPFKRNGFTISWGLPESMQGADACFVVNPKTGGNVIFLKSYPTDYADAFLIAHEICHVILKESELSFTINISEEEYKYVAQNIRSLLEDPIVDSCLQDTYGFDLLKYYLYKVIPSEMEFIDEHPDESYINDIGKLANTFFYAGQILKWKLIDDDAAIREWREYQLLYERTYPTISRRGKELASFAILRGYDTPEKRKLLAKIITRIYNLYNILDIAEYPSILSYPSWRQ